MQREYFTWNIGKSCIFRFHRLYMAILKKRKTILSELWPEALLEPCFASFLLLSLLLFKLLIRAHKPCNIYLKLRKNSESALQFVIFNPWKVPSNWIAFSQNYFVTSTGLLYHLIRRSSGRLANEAFKSNPAVSLKQ